MDTKITDEDMALKCSNKNQILVIKITNWLINKIIILIKIALKS